MLIGLTGFMVIVHYACHHSSESQRNERTYSWELLKQLDTVFQSNPRQGLILASKLQAISVRQNDSLLLAKTLLKKASCFQTLNMEDSALSCYTELKELAVGLRNDSIHTRINNGLANYYLRREEYPKAMFYLCRALEYAEKSGDSHGKGLVYNGLGLISVSMKKYDQALDYFSKARIACQASGDRMNEAGITLNIANCYAEVKEFRTAREYYHENLDTQLQLQDTAQMILGMINLAIVNRYMEEPDSSFKSLKEAFRLLSFYPDQSLLSTAQLEMGSLFTLKGELKKAEEYFELSLSNASGTLWQSNAMEAYLRMSQIHEKERNFGQSLAQYKKYTAMKDSVMNDESRKSIAEIQLKFDVQRKELQNQLLSQKIALQQRRTTIMIIGVSAISIIFLLIALVVWVSHKSLKKSFHLQELSNAHFVEKARAEEISNRLEQLRLSSEIENKNKELTTLSLQLVAKNKVLGDIDRMAEETYRDKLMDQQSCRRLKRMVRENMNTDKDWEKFKELYEKIHQNFFVHLKTDYPGLTENELRLCAYIRINCPNKEIAKVLNVTPSTIVTSRYRIRKKMKLETSVVLEDFLRKF